MLWLIFAAIMLIFTVYSIVTHLQQKRAREAELARIQRRLAEKEAEAQAKQE